MKNIFCAIDTKDLSSAEDMVRKLKNASVNFKLGLEFFSAHGIAGVEKIRAAAGDKAEIFLDLKFHDIPNTVAGAVKSVLSAKPQFLTVHASGGMEMMKAAVQAAGGKVKILAVTVLTSLDGETLESVGQSTSVSAQVLRLARLAKESGAAGAVCSPHEIEMLKKEMGKDFLLVVPGIRPAGSDKGDQKRTMTPEEAFRLGADYLVVGRPITEAADPLLAVQSLLGALPVKALSNINE